MAHAAQQSLREGGCADDHRVRRRVGVDDGVGIGRCQRIPREALGTVISCLPGLQEIRVVGAVGNIGPRADWQARSLGPSWGNAIYRNGQ